ncbi:major facilitator superfamily domain-containing protein [Trichoderma sp. SZMC 28014]
MAAGYTLTGKASIRGNSEMVRMVLLTFCTIGITFTWGVEMTYCTPYLLNLGLSKSNVSLVWIAGPLSGLIVQPIVGVVADESTSRWGRRRPLMMMGAVIVSLCLLVLGFTREIVGAFMGGDGGDATRRLTIVVAVAAIYAVDFAINAIMSCSRSLIVDTLPLEKQQAGAAWGSRMNSIGHMIGYGAGSIDLVRLFPGLADIADTQFKQLTVIAAMAILGTTSITCWAVTERVLRPNHDDSHSLSAKKLPDEGPLKVFHQIRSTLLTLPPRVQAICWAQFWSWIGWFPFLFYSTVWVGETKIRYDTPSDAKSSSADVLGEIGRIGSFALVLYSTVSFLAAFFLPMMVRSPAEEKFTPRPPRVMAGLLEKLEGIKPDLLTAWIIGDLMFASAMAMAPLAKSFVSATTLMCICGIPWAIAMWAPTAFLGIEVNKLSGAQDPSAALPLTPTRRNSNSHAQSSSGELSGIYFGILNIYTTLPQFIGTFISTIVFAIMEPGKSPELHDETKEAAAAQGKEVGGTNAIAVCLFIGAMSMLVAAHMTRKLRRL